MKAKRVVGLGDISAALLVALTVSLTACTTIKPHGTGHSYTADSGHATLELNEGKKWVVVKPMIAHIRNIETDVKQFQVEKAGPREHTALAAAIQENLGRLVTNCTMEGPAHEALHRWLLPFLAISTDYSAATELSDQQQKYREIEQALLAFNENFE